MYITRFVCYDGPDEEYYYHSQKDAEAHMNLFVGDDSGLYKSIMVCDEEDNVLKSITF